MKTAKLYVIGILSSLILTFFNPSFGSLMPKETAPEIHERVFYSVTIYRFYGVGYEKQEKQISCTEAISIEKKYHEIEENEENKILQAWKKLDLLVRYNILSKNDPIVNLLEEYLLLMQKDAKTIFFLFDPIGLVIGSFYGSTFNFLNLGALGIPLLIQSAEGGDILDFLLFMIPLHFSTSEPLVFISSLFVGIISLIPFIDPDGGDIFGISCFTVATTQY